MALMPKETKDTREGFKMHECIFCRKDFGMHRSNACFKLETGLEACGRCLRLFDRGRAYMARRSCLRVFGRKEDRGKAEEKKSGQNGI